MCGTSPENYDHLHCLFVILDIIFDHIFTSHHAGNGLQMNSTYVTKDKPGSCYNRPASDNDKPGRVTDKPGSVTDRPLS